MNEKFLIIKHNDIPPEQGRTLIAEPFLRDMPFRRAVILLTEYSPQSAMGYVLNKKLPFYLDDLVDTITAKQRIPIYYGGPVDKQLLFFIHRLEFLPNSYKISDSLFLNGDFNMLLEYINLGTDISGKIKFFLGYAGWTAGQLDAEIEGNTWLVGEPEEQEMIEPADEELWETALLRLDEGYRLWTEMPLYPDDN